MLKMAPMKALKDWISGLLIKFCARHDHFGIKFNMIMMISLLHASFCNLFYCVSELYLMIFQSTEFIEELSNYEILFYIDFFGFIEISVIYRNTCFTIFIMML